MDFALWIKAEPDHILKWPSPWSIGYPGWHIECSVMSKKYLSDTFDIHGGGIENIFPHNESEIAQTEALSGKKMANYWVLWNMVMVDGEKMGKSKGNFTTVQDLLKEYDPMVVRLAIFKSHYRSPIDFNPRMFDESATNLTEIRNVILGLKQSQVSTDNELEIEGIIKTVKENFKQAMDDDFNTPLAFSVFSQFIKVVKRDLALLNSEQAEQALDLIYDLDNVLGLKLDELIVVETPREIRNLLETRAKARENKDWASADELRAEINKAGYEVEDTETGQKTRKL